VLNAVPDSGALGVTQQLQAAFGPDPRYCDAINPFDPEAAIDRQAAILKTNLNAFGNQNDALNTDNAGTGKLTRTINQLSSDYLAHLSAEGQTYAANINKILAEQRKIPRYFGSPR